VPFATQPTTSGSARKTFSQSTLLLGDHIGAGSEVKPSHPGLEIRSTRQKRETLHRPKSALLNPSEKELLHRPSMTDPHHHWPADSLYPSSDQWCNDLRISPLPLHDRLPEGELLHRPAAMVRHLQHADSLYPSSFPRTRWSAYSDLRLSPLPLQRPGLRWGTRPRADDDSRTPPASRLALPIRRGSSSTSTRPADLHQPPRKGNSSHGPKMTGFNNGGSSASHLKPANSLYP
jgi:hypothetical protein